MKIGSKDFDIKNRTYVMGILNVTPDSFSDGGMNRTPDQALYHCEQMLKEGADLIDVGGESTRPGHRAVSEQEEIERVSPVIEAIRSRFDPVISLDTRKSRVAAAGIAAGADLINDISGLTHDPAMAGLIGEAGIPCCLMAYRDHGMEDPEESPEAFLRDLEGRLGTAVRTALSGGIGKDRIILDPGVGFGRTRQQDLLTLRILGDLNKAGYPVLLGASRKRVIGEVLGLAPEERDNATTALSVYAAMKGCAFVRVHNVGLNVQALRMLRAVGEAGDGGYSPCFLL